MFGLTSDGGIRWVHCLVKGSPVFFGLRRATGEFDIRRVNVCGSEDAQLARMERIAADNVVNYRRNIGGVRIF